MFDIRRKIKAWIADFSISDCNNTAFDMVYCGRRRVAAITDADLLLKIVQNNARSRVRNLALKRIASDVHLQRIINDCNYADIKVKAISRLGTGHDEFYKEFIAAKGRFEGQTVLTQVAMNMLSLDGMLEICFLLRASSMEKLINFLLKLYTLETLTEVLILPLLTGKEVSRQVKQLLWNRVDSNDFYLSYHKNDFVSHLLDLKYGKSVCMEELHQLINLSITLELPIDKMEYILKQIHRNSFIEVKDMKLFLILNVPDELVDDMLNCSDRRLVKAAEHWCNARNYTIKHHTCLLYTSDAADE